MTGTVRLSQSKAPKHSKVLFLAEAIVAKFVEGQRRQRSPVMKAREE
jgi:hypothetical protein